MSQAPKVTYDTRGRVINQSTPSATPGISTAQNMPPTTNKKLFGNMIPDEFKARTPAIYQRVAFKTKVTGLALFAIVGAVYGYTMYNLKQEDFEDVLVPDSIKNTKNTVNNK
jgi:hypothetical protein